mmetsp:Transcript_35153/g.91986  ORF Transcript_35153/g.91986 Transcript_35153/m.91986 type:complete len:103 (+) Transcript_35153:1823-2131(+)
MVLKVGGTREIGLGPRLMAAGVVQRLVGPARLKNMAAPNIVAHAQDVHSRSVFISVCHARAPVGSWVMAACLNIAPLFCGSPNDIVRSMSVSAAAAIAAVTS